MLCVVQGLRYCVVYEIKKCIHLYNSYTIPYIPCCSECFSFKWFVTHINIYLSGTHSMDSSYRISGHNASFVGGALLGKFIIALFVYVFCDLCSLYLFFVIVFFLCLWQIILSWCLAIESCVDITINLLYPISKSHHNYCTCIVLSCSQRSIKWSYFSRSHELLQVHQQYH